MFLDNVSQQHQHHHPISIGGVFTNLSEGRVVTSGFQRQRWYGGVTHCLEDIQDLVICVDVCIFPQVIAALLKRLLTLHRACWRLRARDPWIYCICFWICIYEFQFVFLNFCIFECLYLYFVLHWACWRLRARDPWILHNQQWHTVTKLPSSLFHNHRICQHIYRSLFFYPDPKDQCIELTSYDLSVVLCPISTILYLYWWQREI